jgi:hypothetical protein
MGPGWTARAGSAVGRHHVELHVVPSNYQMLHGTRAATAFGLVAESMQAKTEHLEYFQAAIQASTNLSSSRRTIACDNAYFYLARQPNAGPSTFEVFPVSMANPMSLAVAFNVNVGE